MTLKIGLIKKNSKATQTILAFASLILLIIIFSILSPHFFTYSNMTTILLATAVNGILAVGITFIIITGGIDLSIGTVMTFCSVMCAVFITNLGFPIIVGLLMSVVAGAICGFTNGVLIAKLKLPPFIATLGMMNVTRGLNLIISGTKPVYIDAEGFYDIAIGMTIGIPNGVLIFFISAIVAAFILSKTLIINRFVLAFIHCLFIKWFP